MTTVSMCIKNFMNSIHDNFSFELPLEGVLVDLRATKNSIKYGRVKNLQVFMTLLIMFF